MQEPLFPNPEVAWHQESIAGPVQRVEITRRLGPVDEGEDVVCLSGGLANSNLRIGSDRVLRIYRRDKKALPRERDLVSRNWQHIRTPRIFDEGNDFLVLEYVEKHPLENTQAHGLAVGTALAEIHQTRFDSCGSFADAIEVEKAWDDFPLARTRRLFSTVNSTKTRAR